MRRNLSTLLAVFAVIFALAFLLNRGKVRSAAPPSDVASTPAPNPAELYPPTPTEVAGQMDAPAADSIARSPATGMPFGGGGRYQLYRQGDLTWRLDTQTGRTCILFATDDQWSKLRVYEHGCGDSN